MSYADINVRAGWETAATAVLAVIVAGIFVAGIVRTVRRRRRLASTRDEGSDPRPDEVGDARPEPDAASASPAGHSG